MTGRFAKPPRAGCRVDPNDWQPRIIAHRGLWRPRGLPENSFDAFEAAYELGFDCECDVWASADGEPVVIHDGTLDRTTVGRGPVASLSAADLARLPLGDRQGRPTRHCVPLLADVAGYFGLVEIKPPDARDLVKRVLEITDGRCLIQSFDEANLVHALSFRHEPPVAYLVEDRRGVEVAVAGRWPVHIDHRLLDEPLMDRLRGHCPSVGVWTVNEPDDIRRVRDLGPDVIISDEPQRVLEVIRG